VAFHRKTIHPNGLMLGVTGDFDKSAMLILLQDVFGGWKRGEVPVLTIADVPQVKTAKPVVRFVSKDTSQRISASAICRSKRTIRTMSPWQSRTTFLVAAPSAAASLTTCGPGRVWLTRSAAV